MTIKSFTALCAAAAIALALAVVAILGQPRFESSDQQGEALFPTLLRDEQSLKTVVIRQGEATISLDRDGTNWRVRERFNYPANNEKITGLIISLARMTKIEGKTKLTDRYGRLEVEDPAAKNSRSRQVVLIDAGGKELANVILGKQQYSMGTRGDNTYVRLPGDPQAWLASGGVTAETTSDQWLERGIADISSSLIKRVTVTHPNGEKIIVSRQSPETPNMTIENTPKGVQPAGASAADEYGRMLTGMALDDLAPAADKPFPKGKTISALIEGLVGFQVTLDLAEIDGQEWIRIKAAASGGGDVGLGESKMVDMKTDWDKIMGEMNQRTNGYVFQVPAYQIAPLKNHMSDLVKKP